jgi:hypothetical protein
MSRSAKAPARVFPTLSLVFKYVPESINLALNVAFFGSDNA